MSSVVRLSTSLRLGPVSLLLRAGCLHVQNEYAVQSGVARHVDIRGDCEEDWRAGQDVEKELCYAALIVRCSAHFSAGPAECANVIISAVLSA